MQNHISPAVSQLLHRFNLQSSIASITKTGPKGNLLKGDVLLFLTKPKVTLKIYETRRSASDFPTLLPALHSKLVDLVSKIPEKDDQKDSTIFVTRKTNTGMFSYGIKVSKSKVSIEKGISSDKADLVLIDQTGSKIHDLELNENSATQINVYKEMQQLVFETSCTENKVAKVLKLINSF